MRPENRPWTGLWRDAFARTDRFGPLLKRGFPFSSPLDLDQLVALVASWSFVAAMPEPSATSCSPTRPTSASHGDEPLRPPVTTDVYVTTRRAPVDHA